MRSLFDFLVGASIAFIAFEFGAFASVIPPPPSPQPCKTFRDELAAVAALGFIIQGHTTNEALATQSYALADSMIRERSYPRR